MANFLQLLEGKGVGGGGGGVCVWWIFTPNNSARDLNMANSHLLDQGSPTLVLVYLQFLSYNWAEDGQTWWFY